MSKRRRYLNGSVSGFQEVRNAVTGALLSKTPYNAPSSTLEVMSVTYGHPINRLGHTRATDLGGPFLLQRCSIDPGIASVCKKFIGPGGFLYILDGTCCASSAGVGNPTAASFLAPSGNSTLDSYGTTGISRALPTNPLSGMGQFIGELHEPPRIPRSLTHGIANAARFSASDPSGWRAAAQNFRRLARNGSDEYLNVTFGWLPFVQDIRDFFGVTANLARIVQQFEHNSGQNVRRSRTIIDTTTTTSSTISGPFGAYPYPPMNTSAYRRVGRLIQDVTTHNKVWFSGCFTYYLPPSGSADWLSRFEQYAHRLYGLRIDPDLLWRLAPWSWAADWFTNAGDIARNWSGFSHDGLVMRYGYVMELKEVTTRTSLVDCLWQDGTPAMFTDVIRQSTKSRRGATPYGFGLNPATFTPRQAATISALAINRWAGWR